MPKLRAFFLAVGEDPCPTISLTGHFLAWRLLHAHVGVWLRDGREAKCDLKDSEVVAYIDFSLSDPLARGCSSLKVSDWL